jgi:hypothetical protein
MSNEKIIKGILDNIIIEKVKDKKKVKFINGLISKEIKYEINKGNKLKKIKKKEKKVKKVNGLIRQKSINIKQLKYKEKIKNILEIINFIY